MGVGDFIVIKNRPCEVVDVKVLSHRNQISKDHKGHDKMKITAMDLFNEKIHHSEIPTHHFVDCPNVEEKFYTVRD
jgi:translation elongation factor P/translation initiation factor 5A